MFIVGDREIQIVQEKEKEKEMRLFNFLSFCDGSQCNDLMGIVEIEIEWSKSLNLHALNKEIRSGSQSL